MENPILQRQTRTILQQIEELKNWHKLQQSKLETNNATENTETLPKLRLENTKNKNVMRPQLEKSTVTQQNFDEIPIKVANPNFNKIIENNINPNTEHASKSQQNGVKPKFRYLKRGEGIARFQMGPQKAPKAKSKKVWTLSLSGATSKASVGEPDVLKDPKLNPENERSCPRESNQLASLNPPDLKLDFKNWKSIFDSGKVEEMFEKAISNNQLELFQPDSSVDSSTASIMERFIAVGKKHLKEREELRVFEAIEQHLLDSSFCSNSSYVAKLMENAVISTPIKKTFGNQNAQDLQTKTSQLPTVVIENTEEEATVKETTDQPRPEPAVWINSNGFKEPAQKSQEAVTIDDLEHSLHVRFAEEVDYKSFVDFSQSVNDSNPKSANTSKELDDNEEWKEDSGEESVCCSQCSTSYSSSDDDLEAITPLGKPPRGRRNPIPKLQSLKKDKEINKNSINKLDMADLNTKDEIGKNKTCSNDDVDKLSPILGSKVKELEYEIETFRGENNKLKALRETLEKERKYFQIEKKKFLLEYEEEKKKNAVQLEQEKQKLSKEKFIFEKYSKSLSKNPSKEERKEIQGLREQLAELKEELNRKESRWGAAQARVRNQVKVLEEDNKKLREEVEVLRKQAKHLEFLTNKKNKPFNNTKLIHAISEYVSNTPIEDESVAKTLSGVGYFDSKPNSVKSIVVDEVNPKHIGSIKVIKENRKENKLRSVSGGCSTKTVDESYKHTVSENEQTSNPLHVSNQIPTNKGMEGKHETNDCLVQKKVHNSQIISAESAPNSPQELVKEDGTVEKIYPDGKREIKYKNGNIKRLDPFSGNEKTIYFNGDVKENLIDGTVKYYFSESRIWHTTLPDGLEVLDFPNGQVEKRHTNGMVEIVYPNDCRKLSFSDGTEEILYADGTKLKIEADKRKVLSLPNGQREIHTEECVRREYPDGTVKIVYPDGVTETVYANGRVRLKDKHGNLVMDSGTSTNRL